MRFGRANAAVGINLRESPRTHYNAVTDAFRAVIDSPPGLHYGIVKLRGHKAISKDTR